MCKKKFSTNYYNQIFCSKNCRNKFYLSKKTYPPCIICGFDKVTESHHIIWRVYNGSDNKKNLISLCPNHHRMIHNEKYREDIENLIGINLKNLVENNHIVPPSNSPTASSHSFGEHNMGLEVPTSSPPKSPTATSPNPNIKRNLRGLLQSS